MRRTHQAHALPTTQCHVCHAGSAQLLQGAERPMQMCEASVTVSEPS